MKEFEASHIKFKGGACPEKAEPHALRQHTKVATGTTFR